MPPSSAPNQIVETTPTLLSDLRELFEDMDREYDKISSDFGFKCTGCAENCCQSLFFHHTVAEWVYLQIGFTGLDDERRLAMHQRAEKVNRRILASSPQKVMCAANVEGFCQIYPYRPMICRMHGIPNILRLPNGKRIEGPGCDAFVNRSNPKAARPMDRTPFYQRLAIIEKTVRCAIGFTKKIRKTVSEMIVDSLLP